MTTLTAIPTFPAIGSATFNADAYAWAVFMAGTHRTEINLIQYEISTNATTATTKAAEALATSLLVQADRVLAQAAAAAVAAQSPVTNAAAAAASALAAAGYATLAQATNPDSPIRLNPRRITTALNIASGYNAESVGPITIAEGITVTVSDNATWSVN